MSWDDPNAPRPEPAVECRWCDGSGHYVCATAAMIGKEHAADVEHRGHRNALAHRCGQCNGSGIARVVSIR